MFFDVLKEYVIYGSTPPLFWYTVLFSTINNEINCKIWVLKIYFLPSFCGLIALSAI